MRAVTKQDFIPIVIEQQSGIEMKLFCRSGNNDSIFHHVWPSDPSSTFTPPQVDPEEPEAADVSLTAATDVSSWLLKVSSELGALFLFLMEEAKKKKKKFFISAKHLFGKVFTKIPARLCLSPTGNLELQQPGYTSCTEYTHLSSLLVNDNCN